MHACEAIRPDRRGCRINWTEAGNCEQRRNRRSSRAGFAVAGVAAVPEQPGHCAFQHSLPRRPPKHAKLAAAEGELTVVHGPAAISSPRPPFHAARAGHPDMLASIAAASSHRMTMRPCAASPACQAMPVPVSLLSIFHPSPDASSCPIRAARCVAPVHPSLAVGHSKHRAGAGSYPPSPRHVALRQLQTPQPTTTHSHTRQRTIASTSATPSPVGKLQTRQSLSLPDIASCALVSFVMSPIR